MIDSSDPNAPKIADLPAYLDSTKKYAEKRYDMINQDFFYQAKTPGAEQA